jgi:hypothetical protein
MYFETSPLNIPNKHNQLDTHFTFNNILLSFSVSTCFGYYLPIFRRQYTNANLLALCAIVDVVWSQNVGPETCRDFEP